MESSEKILNNCDVLESIFRYLDFKEHLKLIKICPQFAYAIGHGVWRRTCKNICYSYSEKFDILLLEYDAENNVRRKYSLRIFEEFDKILQHTSMYIPKLELKNIYDLKNIISFNYYHLKELTLCGIVVKDTHLQQVAKNCINLQSFSLIDFTNSYEESNICANVFGEMKALNILEIDDRNFDVWNYFDVQQLFYLAHLKTLKIDISIRDNKDNNIGHNNKSTNRVNNIENLIIGQLRSANVCFMEDFIRFENLTKLTITSNLYEIASFDDNDLTQINNACPNLCELSFYDCCFKLKEFPRMNNLKHLTLERCSSVTFENVDEIFRKLKLKTLNIIIDQEEYSYRVKEEDVCNYNYISNTLETLTITVGFDANIAAFFNRQHKFENVSKVTLKMAFFEERSTELCFSHIFPHLQELEMDFFYVSSEDILNLKHLKVLEFDIFHNLSWSYLKILFKHPTLTHITIMPNNWEEYGYNGYECLSNCCEGLTTTLEYLYLPSLVYESVSNFWPYFQQRNKLLKLEIVDCNMLRTRFSSWPEPTESTEEDFDEFW